MKLSVLIPTYNHEKYIAQALDSVLMQQVDFDYEILVGEDDSSDGTREIVKKYKDKHPDRISLFLNDRKNVMYIDGRPTGRWNFINLWNHAKGDYIALLEGDDYWTNKDKLQMQVDFLDNHPESSICFHNAKIQYEDEDRRVREFCPPNQKPIIYLEDLFEKNLIPSASVMFRRGLFGEFPDWFFKLSFGDWPLHILNAQYGSAGYLNECMSVYRIHQKGVARDRISITLSKIKLYNYLNKHFTYKYEHILKRWKLFYEAELHAEYYKDALHSICEAVKLYPKDIRLWNVINRMLLEGEGMFTKGDRRTFYSVLNEIVTMRPDYSLAYVYLGILFYLDGEKTTAIKNMDKALEMYQGVFNDFVERDSKLRGLLILEKYCRRLGMQSQAEEIYRHILDCLNDGKHFDPGYRDLIDLGDLFSTREKYSDAEENYRISVDLPGIPEDEKQRVLLKLGRLYSRMKKYKDAVHCLSGISAIKDLTDHERFYALLELGRSQSNLNNYQEACESYNESLSVGSISTELKAIAVLELGKCYSDLGDKPAEEGEYQKALSLYDMPDIWKYRIINRIGNIYSCDGRHDDAISKFSEALSIKEVPDMDRFHAQLGLAYCYYAQGKYQSAEERYEQIISCRDIPGESKLTAVTQLVDCYLVQGKYQDIEGICEKALSQDCFTDEQKRKVIAFVRGKINTLNTQYGGANV